MEHERGATPGTHDEIAAVCDPRQAMVFTETRVEFDHGVDRSAGGSEPAHQQRRRQQAAGDFGNHSFGQCEFAAVESPRRLERHGVGSVVARDGGGRPGRPHGEAAGVGAAHESSEEGLAVEAGGAHPVDGAVGADECGGAGVADQPVVLDGPLWSCDSVVNHVSAR